MEELKDDTCESKFKCIFEITLSLLWFLSNIPHPFWRYMTLILIIPFFFFSFLTIILSNYKFKKTCYNLQKQKVVNFYIFNPFFNYTTYTLWYITMQYRILIHPLKKMSTPTYMSSPHWWCIYIFVATCGDIRIMSTCHRGF